jgi:hypothetical protein
MNHQTKQPANLRGRGANVVVEDEDGMLGEMTIEYAFFFARVAHDQINPIPFLSPPRQPICSSSKAKGNYYPFKRWE